MFQSPELDIASEVYDLIFTSKDASPIKTPLVWLKFRRSEDGRKINCNGCNSKGSIYTEGQQSCPYCNSYGYLYDEQLINGYMYKDNDSRDRLNLNYATPIGRADNTDLQLITDSSILIEKEDKIKILRLNQDGKISIPIKIERTLTCLYSRYLKASQKNSDFNVAVLGG